MTDDDTGTPIDEVTLTMIALGDFTRCIAKFTQVLGCMPDALVPAMQNKDGSRDGLWAHWTVGTVCALVGFDGEGGFFAKIRQDQDMLAGLHDRSETEARLAYERGNRLIHEIVGWSVINEIDVEAEKLED